MDYQHQPVLLDEVLVALQPKKGQRFIDATLGGAGYTTALAKAVGDNGLVVSFDLDPMAISAAQETLAQAGLKNVLLINDNFANLSEALAEHQIFEQFDGIVMDLGLSSAQIADEERGFSFNQTGPLDMAFGPNSPTTTMEIVNHWTESDLARIIKDYGEEPWAGPIAKAIVRQRRRQPIETSQELVEIVKMTLPAKYLARSRQHPATKLFQALRIATNGELDNLEAILNQSLSLLCHGGRIAAVSFHSLEDRLVKQFFLRESKDCLCPPEFPICQCGHKAQLKIVYRHPLTASEAEIAANPRSRSAKLRAASKIN
ncbi:MAG TPA: 16S rRNA (cytosine(1402)-N(4))-methyltransferase RsmH [bacterium]|nr:16S rRNA (cytosine(1402)-N(4))-methyltransferase RsmH [bacterium]